MSRFRFLILLVLVACGGSKQPKTSPEPEALPEDAAVAEEDVGPLPPAPFLDTLIPTAELAAELRLAADSAADEAVLNAFGDLVVVDGSTVERFAVMA